jgi:hypothetical protein
MYLSEKEAELFYNIWYDLTWGINEKNQIIDSFKKPIYNEHLTIEFAEFTKIRNAMWNDPKLIDELLKNNNYCATFNAEMRNIIISWRKYFIKSEFYIIKNVQKYSVMMDTNNSRLFGVFGITHPMTLILPFKPPILVKTVLLPFKDKIIYDSCLLPSNFKFSPGAVSDLERLYKDRIDNYGIIEQLSDKTNPSFLNKGKKLAKKLEISGLPLSASNGGYK